MIRNYLIIALKVIGRHKLFSFISLFGISFTLLILIIVTAFVEHLIGRQKPETGITLTASYFKLKTEKGGTLQGPLVSYYFLEKHFKRLNTPEAVSISSFFENVVTYHNEHKYSWALKFSDGDFWRIYDFDFIEGHGYSENDVRNHARVAVITEKVRREYFGNQPATGQMITIEGDRYQVIGVVRNVSQMRIFVYADVFIPITNSKNDLLQPSVVVNSLPGYYAAMLARSKADLPRIKAEVQQQLSTADFSGTRFVKIFGGADSYAETLSRILVGNMERDNMAGLMLVVLILTLLFMLLPAMNLISINNSRIAERASEIGIRKAFGASSRTLIGQFLVENIFVTLIGGSISLILAGLIITWFNTGGLLPHLSLRINWNVFLTSIFFCLLFGFISGVYPAFKMSRLQPAEVLRGGEK